MPYAHIAPTPVAVIELSSQALRARLTEALRIYVDAMGYPSDAIAQRGPTWLQHMLRPGWRAAAAVDHAGSLLGIAYGYPGAPGQWWYQEVRRGLRRDGDTDSATGVSVRPEWLADYFELTELHVRPDMHGRGIGESLLRVVLSGVDRPVVLLSTPEPRAAPSDRAWRLYRRLGFLDVLRDHRFAGDVRPFAVLGRTLPLPPPLPPRP